MLAASKTDRPVLLWPWSHGMVLASKLVITISHFWSTSSVQPFVDSKLQRPEQGPADTVSSHCQQNDPPINTELVVPNIDEHVNPTAISTTKPHCPSLEHQKMLLDTQFRSDTAMTADSVADGALAVSTCIINWLAVTDLSPKAKHGVPYFTWIRSL